jgi:hypothetical protein
LTLAFTLAATLLPAADTEFLRWDAKRAASILTGQTARGDVGRNLDLRVIRTDRSVNYKLRATWMTPEAIRAAARLEQIAKALSDAETSRLVAEAEQAGDTVVMVELDPREGSGVIPSDWTATLGQRGVSGAQSRTARGVNSPKLRDAPALKGYLRRDYAYDVFWVVFSLRGEAGEPLFTAADREAELSVRIYEKIGRARWPIPDSIRARLP